MKEKSHIRSVIAQNVKKYRKLNGMTQEALAEAANVSNTYIANIECGQTWLSDKTLEKIADALNIDIYLLFMSEVSDKKDIDFLKKRQEMITYLTGRQNEIGKYIKNFFSETFETILKE
ncbi:helix-turn-helix transcriptional regulator [uncultured Treponema sp.]|uniref:helix-turn-helix domain-containing protein n=1 Tax=uncultured Treponema sp. TaxID=162155 RepID=UPI0025ED97D1|nr:helix-turn-helix transcriptional regulator [uncultured Treponema sp.]